MKLDGGAEIFEPDAARRGTGAGVDDDDEVEGSVFVLALRATGVRSALGLSWRIEDCVSLSGLGADAEAAADVDEMVRRAGVAIADPDEVRVGVFGITMARDGNDDDVPRACPCTGVRGLCIELRDDAETVLSRSRSRSRSRCLSLSFANDSDSGVGPFKFPRDAIRFACAFIGTDTPFDHAATLSSSSPTGVGGIGKLALEADALESALLPVRTSAPNSSTSTDSCSRMPSRMCAGSGGGSGMSDKCESIDALDADVRALDVVAVLLLAHDVGGMLGLTSLCIFLSCCCWCSAKLLAADLNVSLTLLANADLPCCPCA